MRTTADLYSSLVQLMTAFLAAEIPRDEFINSIKTLRTEYVNAVWHSDVERDTKSQELMTKKYRGDLQSEEFERLYRHLWGTELETSKTIDDVHDICDQASDLSHEDLRANVQCVYDRIRPAVSQSDG